MKLKDKNSNYILFILIGALIGAVLTYLIAIPQYTQTYGFGPGMMYGTYGPGMMQYMTYYRNSVNANCSNITTSQLIQIGDNLMEQMIGNHTLHEQIDSTYPNIDAMHLMMGRMATGCY